MDLFSNLLTKLSNSNLNFYIAGDINLDVLKYQNNSFVTEYVDLLFSFGTLQLISKPTRCTLNSATVIDHLITNDFLKSSDCYILTSCISDHFPVIVSFKTAKIRPRTHYDQKIFF